jgi:SAM-dependent methyltransferase
MRDPIDIQRRYYTETAAAYDEMHLRADKEHLVALEYISGFVDSLNITSMLDLGCGTGRGVTFLSERHPSLRVVGIEPVKALIDQAILKNGVLPSQLVQGSGERVPLEDQSFDAICELGVLHHVREPDALVREMIRVARKAIFISDSNRFGRAGLGTGLLKLALYRAGLWGMVYRIRTNGKGYSVSSGDGLAYSYSVYDSFDRVREWADRLLPIATSGGKPPNWFHPLLTSPTVLLAAIRDNGSE